MSVPVCLLQMPYSALERPSLALGILKSGLSSANIPSRVLYPNWTWAELLGLEAYQALSESPAAALLGEWTFSGEAFGLALDENFLEEALRREVSANQRSRLREHALTARQKASSFLHQLTEDILALQPRIVGCSSTFQQNCASLALLRHLKEAEPNLITVMGGANCDGQMGRELTRAFPWLDLAVAGEADLLFPELCTQILALGSLPSERLPKAVQSRDSTGPGSRATLNNLDQAPVPDYDDYFQTRLRSKLRRRVYPGLTAETSRGCWWGQKHHCTFCGLNGGGMSYRSKSAERVLEELHNLSQRYQLTQFEIVDNILDPKHLREVLPHLAQHDYTLFYETKANLKRTQLKTLLQAGVRWIQPGIESLHDEILTLMDKGNSAAMNVSLLKQCRELGIRVDWSLLCGFPGEQDSFYEEMADFIPQLFHLEAPIGAFRIRYDRFSPYHTRPEHYGVKLKPYWTYAHCYPEDAKLQELAYFFEDDGPGPPGRCPPLDFAQERTGLQKIRKQVEEWQRRAPQASFWYEHSEESLRFHDTRTPQQARRFELSGLSAELVLLCEEPQSWKSLQRKLEFAPEELEKALQELGESGTVLKLGQRYLTVALGCPAAPSLTHFPGGSVAL